MAPTSETCGTSWTSSWWWELWLPSPWRESLYVAACRWLKTDSLRQTVPCKHSVIVKDLHSSRWRFLQVYRLTLTRCRFCWTCVGHRGQAKRGERRRIMGWVFVTTCLKRCVFLCCQCESPGQMEFCTLCASRCKCKGLDCALISPSCIYSWPSLCISLYALIFFSVVPVEFITVGATRNVMG